MNKFLVPQFIEVEAKIFGPITVRQFLILLAAGLLIFISYKLADFTLFIIITLFLGLFAITFAFVKVNGQNFHYVIQFLVSRFQYRFHIYQRYHIIYHKLVQLVLHLLLFLIHQK